MASVDKIRLGDKLVVGLCCLNETHHKRKHSYRPGSMNTYMMIIMIYKSLTSTVH